MKKIKGKAGARSFVHGKQLIWVGFVEVGVGIFGGSCFRLAWDGRRMTLFDLLPALTLAGPLLVGDPAAQLKDTGIVGIILGKFGMFLLARMLEIVVVLLLANLAILAVGRDQLDPLVFGLQPPHHLILLDPLIEDESMVVLVHLEEVLNEEALTVSLGRRKVGVK